MFHVVDVLIQNGAMTNCSIFLSCCDMAPGGSPEPSCGDFVSQALRQSVDNLPRYKRASLLVHTSVASAVCSTTLGVPAHPLDPRKSDCMTRWRRIQSTSTQ